jgi:hypothetical protein
MANLNKSQLKTELDGAIYENVSQSITATDVNNFLTDLIDSSLNATDNPISVSLQDATNTGNTTSNNIQLINSAEVIFGAGGGILLDNGSRLRE